MAYNLLINGVYWGYNPLTSHLLTSWDIQVSFQGRKKIPKRNGIFSGIFLNQKGDMTANSKPRNSTKALFQLTLPETNSSHLKIGLPRRKVSSLPTIHFHVLC